MTGHPTEDLRQWGKPKLRINEKAVNLFLNLIALNAGYKPENLVDTGHLTEDLRQWGHHPACSTARL